jgi:hypothetical protein
MPDRTFGHHLTAERTGAEVRQQEVGLVHVQHVERLTRVLGQEERARQAPRAQHRKDGLVVIHEPVVEREQRGIPGRSARPSHGGANVSRPIGV